MFECPYCRGVEIFVEGDYTPQINEKSQKVSGGFNIQCQNCGEIFIIKIVGIKKIKNILNQNPKVSGSGENKELIVCPWCDILIANKGNYKPLVNTNTGEAKGDFVLQCQECEYLLEIKMIGIGPIFNQRKSPQTTIDDLGPNGNIEENTDDSNV